MSNKIKKNLNELLDKSEQKEIPGENRQDFSEVKYNYIQDIGHVDSRMTQLQDYISGLQVQVNNLKSKIMTETNPGQKGKFYQIMNEALELIATFESLYLKAMEVKFRYRKEQSDFVQRKARYFEIEIPKMGLEEKSSELNNTEMVKMLSELDRKISSTKPGIKNNELLETIVSIENDNKYKL